MMLGILLGIGALALLTIFLTMKNLVVISPPSEVVIFSGPNPLADQKVGYRFVRGGRRLRIPLLEKVDRLDLTVMSVDVAVRGAYTVDGVPINVQGVANVKIDGDLPGLDNAVERLLGKSHEAVIRISRETLEGNLRGVLAKLTPEEVNEDKEKFAEELIEEAEIDLQRLGLKLDILKIQTVSDDVGYLDSIGRKKNADLRRRARIAEADRTSESVVNSAENLQATRLRQIAANMDIAKAENNKRVVSAKTQRAADVAAEEGDVEAQIARAQAELAVQRARIEQVKLQLEADLIKPALAYRLQKQAQARAKVASIRENGRAAAAGLRELSGAWLRAGDNAREIFILEKLRGLIAILVGTVNEIKVDQLTVVGSDGGQGTTAGKVAGLIEQLRSAADIDLPEILKGIGIGAKAAGSTRLEESQPRKKKSKGPAQG
jgi:flotillin